MSECVGMPKGMVAALRAAAAEKDPIPAIRRAVCENAGDFAPSEETLREWSRAVRLPGVHENLVWYHMRAECGYEPVPGSAQVAAWLRAHGEELADVTPLDLRRATLYHSDWSIHARRPIAAAEYADAPGLTARIWAEMRAAGAAAAVGRWDHERPTYGGALFATSGESRTVHIGVDVFMDAGTPVFAPLDGVVHSFADNAAKFDYGPCVVLAHDVGGGVPKFFTLYGHLDRQTLRDLRVGDVVRRGGVIGRMGPYPDNGDWPPHVHVQLIMDMLNFRGDFNGSCRKSQRDVWLSLCPDANLVTQVKWPAVL
jgi:murein DD-endopeptidase MepM/ murein hydrolase activator NlpD